MKRIRQIFFVFAFCLLLGLTACGGTEAPSGLPQEEEPASGPSGNAAAGGEADS